MLRSRLGAPELLLPAALLDRLDEAIGRGWWDADHTRADEDLASLHGDERWAGMLQRCAQARETFLSSLQQPQLYVELMEMKRVDQETGADLEAEAAEE